MGLDNPKPFLFFTTEIEEDKKSKALKEIQKLFLQYLTGSLGLADSNRQLSPAEQKQILLSAIGAVFENLSLTASEQNEILLSALLPELDKSTQNKQEKEFIFPPKPGL